VSSQHLLFDGKKKFFSFDNFGVVGVQHPTKVVHRLNSRPRRCLDYPISHKAFMELTAFNAMILVKSICLS
jgi:hypothetical protein